MGTDRLVREALKAALLDLLETKPIERITVSDITSAAGVGRRTFYNHFRDKNELAAQIWLDRFESAWFVDGRRATLEEYFHNMTRQWTSQVGRNALPALFAYKGQNNVWDTVREASISGLLRLITWNGWPPGAVTEEVEEAIHFYVHGVVGLARELAESMQFKADGEYEWLYIRQSRQVVFVPDAIKPLLLSRCPYAGE